MRSTVLRDNFGDNGHDFCAHETDSELQLLRCLLPTLQFLSDPACQRSSDSGPVCFQDLARYPWWGSTFGVGGSGRCPVSLLTSTQRRRGTEATEDSAPRDKEFISKEHMTISQENISDF